MVYCHLGAAMIRWTVSQSSGRKVLLHMSILEVLTLLLVVFAALTYIDNRK